MSYLIIAGSNTAHKSTVADDCHYWLRVSDRTDFRTTETKPRDCSVCDECQRLEKKAKAFR